MAKGWIKLYRQLQENEIWNCGKFDKAHAWIDLLMLANSKTENKLYKGKVMEFKKGDVNYSIKYLADRWGWNWRTVNYFLNTLQKLDMVLVKKCKGEYTTITIVNYGKFQNRSNESTHQNTHQNADLNTHQSANIKEDIRNNKEYKEGESPTSEEVALAKEEKEKRDPDRLYPGDPGYNPDRLYPGDPNYTDIDWGDDE